ncbi:MAG: hypothetical protein IJ272_08895 [Clostridia bacterium]|nr:hypothetical protein [Clostridia bacterium]
MNRIYLFGRVVFKSKLKYIIAPKLKVYIEVTIETISRDKFNVIFYEDKCDWIKNVRLKSYIFVEGFGIMDKEKIQIYINKICI